MTASSLVVVAASAPLRKGGKRLHVMHKQPRLTSNAGPAPEAEAAFQASVETSPRPSCHRSPRTGCATVQYSCPRLEVERFCSAIRRYPGPRVPIHRVPVPLLRGRVCAPLARPTIRRLSPRLSTPRSAAPVSSQWREELLPLVELVRPSRVLYVATASRPVFPHL